MTTFACALQICGLSQKEAADYFDVRIDTVKSWSAGRNAVPAGVWDMLAGLWRRIEDAADDASLTDAIDSPMARLNVDADDADGLPGGGPAVAGAMALLFRLADDQDCP